MLKWVFNIVWIDMHRNATHLPLNDHNPPSLSLMQLPPSDDVDFDVGTNANGWCGGGTNDG